MSILDAVIAYKFVRIVSTPFNKTEAYKLGIIDEKGNILIPRTKLKSSQQKKAYPSVFYTLCWNIKRLLTKVGLGSRIGSFVSALYLLKEKVKEIKESRNAWEKIQFAAMQMLEEKGLGDQLKNLNESVDGVMYPGVYMINYETYVVEQPILAHDHCLGVPVFKVGKRVTNLLEARKVEEDGAAAAGGGGAPANNVGGGAIAGVSPGQEPPGPKGGFKALQKIKKKRKKRIEMDNETINIVSPPVRRDK
jgi:hypothetical protein